MRKHLMQPKKSKKIIASYIQFLSVLSKTTMIILSPFQDQLDQTLGTVLAVA